VAGSGPTDRDGNSNLGIRSDASKLLAQALEALGIGYDDPSLPIDPEVVRTVQALA
jgi:hypothetical protein